MLMYTHKQLVNPYFPTAKGLKWVDDHLVRVSSITGKVVKRVRMSKKDRRRSK